ncbi:hypothetical protein NC651_009211 [Populus alba x Populus x berolinensis]|nr:hypothetical protein NC651_009211 [Populus alba x Populus x berolinensis]
MSQTPPPDGSATLAFRMRCFDAFAFLIIWSRTWLIGDAWELRLRVLLAGWLSENSEAAFYDTETCRLIWSLEVQVSARLQWMVIVRERKRKELINYSRNSLPIILRKRKAAATVHIACIRDSGVGVEISAFLFPETKLWMQQKHD